MANQVHNDDILNDSNNKLRHPPKKLEKRNNVIKTYSMKQDKFCTIKNVCQN